MDLYFVNPLVQGYADSEAKLQFDQDDWHVGLKRGREWLEVEAGEEKAAPATGRTALGISRTRDDGVRCQQQGPRELGGETLDPGSDGVVPASALRGEGDTSTRSRKDKCLTVLARNFLDLMPEHPHYLEINWASLTLSVPKRRIYDITGVLEGIGLVEKRKNHVRRTAKWKEIARESAAQATRELADWRQKDAMLDEQIDRVKREMASLQARFQGLMYVTEADVARSLPQNDARERVFAVHWNGPSTQMHVETSDTELAGAVPADYAAGATPVEEVEEPKHAITFKSPKGSIECMVLNVDDAHVTARALSASPPHSPNNAVSSPPSNHLLDACSSPAVPPSSIQPQNVASCSPGLLGGACGQYTPASEARLQGLLHTPSSADGICHKLEMDQYWDDGCAFGTSSDGGSGIGFSEMFLPLHHNQCSDKESLDDLSLFLRCFHGGDAVQV
mmetsp:Transcript_33617/g.64370  ORF Transcript_33617/g.64370 Transcript_33617/m.64370 type:complete len:449 (-) Transcript_33617:168-1514(-)